MELVPELILEEAVKEAKIARELDPTETYEWNWLHYCESLAALTSLYLQAQKLAEVPVSRPS